MLLVVKYGGNAMATGAQDTVLDHLAGRIRDGDRIVLVHGGGPQIDAALLRLGIETSRVAGQRVTNAAALEVTEAALGATVNKSLVRALTARGVRAAGLSGEDGGLLLARRMRGPGGEDLGFVGEIADVSPGLLVALLDAGFTPVVAPLAYDPAAGTALNVNADASAGAIAAALKADRYVAVTDVERVRRDVADPASGIAAMTAGEAAGLLAGGSFGGGMAPKIASVLAALEGGARGAVVCSAANVGAALEGRAGTIVTG